jgi:uncharacterized 2Fe-2S/4Fe-4S cluster protein (DUF4445 family)
MTVTVEFQPTGKRVDVKKGSTILEAAQAAGVEIRSVCAGVGACGKCKVIVEEGDVLERSDSYKKFIFQDDNTRGYHLACQAQLLTDTRVVIPPESRFEGQQILTNALFPKVEFDPCCRKQFLRANLAELDDRSGRIQKVSSLVTDVFGRQIPFSDLALLKLDRMEIQGAEGFTVTLDKCTNQSEVVDIDIGDTSLRNYGLAIDLGTTKIVTYLVDFRDGRIMDIESGYNEQLNYGEDLLSRIDYVFRSSEGLYRLQKASVDTINKIVGVIISRNNIAPDEIIDLTVAGNTVMTYLFAGLDPLHLVNANVQVSRDPIQRKAQKFGITTNPNASVYCLPNVSRFVGGDAVADVLTSGMCQSTEISILVDMGTNGEIVIGSKGWLLSTSCAAGPAFEGWGIRFGIRSVEGAIERIKIEPKSLRSTYKVIGGPERKPRGICGSGIIDAAAEMYQSGIIDFCGKIIEKKSDFIREGIDGLEYVVSPTSENDLQKDIVITQRDINNLMDSKAALCGSVAVLMKKIGVTVIDIENLYLAGAFGRYIDQKSATTLGVFPEFPKAETIQLGNGSIAGSYLALLSAKKRAEAEEIAETMTYYDLTVDSDFIEEYNTALYIPGNPELFPSMER